MLLVIQQNLGFAWGALANVTVPNVVGETQAQATTDIGAIGLTTSPTFAYDAVVAFGLVISQNPVGGSSVSPGSDVAIVVSLGPQPTTSGFVGGGGGGGFYRRGKTLEERPEKHLKKILENVETIYREIIDGPPPPEVAEIIAPITAAAEALADEESVDFEQLERDAAHIGKQLRAWAARQRRNQSDADDEWFLLSD